MYKILIDKLKLVKVEHSSKEWAKFLILAYCYVVLAGNDIA